MDTFSVNFTDRELVALWTRLQVKEIAPGIAQITMSREQMDELIDKMIACEFEMDMGSGRIRWEERH